MKGGSAVAGFRATLGEETIMEFGQIFDALEAGYSTG